MAFPQTPLDLTVEIKLDGVWTDITSLVYDRDNLVISRGRSSETVDAERSTCRFTGNNRSGNLSPRNPVGTYYGMIGRNTPCRVRIGPVQDSYLLNRTLDLLNRVYTPDSANLSITGDIDIRVDITPDSWGPVVAGLALKYDAITLTDQRSWVFAANENDRLFFRWSTDGTFGATQDRTSTAAFTVTPGQRLALRVTLDVNNGAGGHDVKFYTAPTMAGSWTQLGSTITTAGATSIFDSAATLQLGGLPITGLRDFVIGKVHAFQMYQGIAGTLRADLDFADVEPGDTTFTDATGNEWTLTSDMSVVDPALRFRGEVSDWPQRWDVSGRDVYVPIEASGVLRRLKQGASPTMSTLRRGYTRLIGTNAPVAYWPAEDGETSTEIASAIGTKPMTLVGAPEMAANSDFPSSDPIPVLTNSEWFGLVPNHAPTGEIQVWMLLSIPDGGATDTQGIFSLFTTGTAFRWSLLYGTGGTINLGAYNKFDTELDISGPIAFNLDGEPERISLALEQDGADVNWTLLGQRLNGAVGGIGGTFTGMTIGRATKVQVNPRGGLGDVAFGHVSVHSTIRDPFDLINEFTSWKGETAGRRIQRLCDQEVIGHRPIGNIDLTARMGPQRTNEVVALIQEAADTDGGILFEPRDMYGLAYRTRESLYAQDPALELDYSAKHLSGIEPLDDDQLLRNDITVKRESGSSARAILETGRLSVLPPPDGVGRYDEQVTINVEIDEQLPDQAGWRLHLGTVDEARYPVLAVDLARSVFVADADLTADVENLDVGDRLTVENPPAWLPPEDISQLAQGFVETLAAFTRTIDINCSPETPWGQVAYYDDDDARYSSDGTVLAEALDTTETAIDISTPSGPVWTDADGDFDWMIGGERMTVTAISGTGAAQTATVTRSVNGIVKSHASGATVELAHPSVYVI